LNVRAPRPRPSDGRAEADRDDHHDHDDGADGEQCESDVRDFHDEPPVVVSLPSARYAAGRAPDHEAGASAVTLVNRRLIATLHRTIALLNVDRVLRAIGPRSVVASRPMLDLPVFPPASRAHAPNPHSSSKTNGIHYTPPELAAFVARRALRELPRDEVPVVLDPACGEGELLLAVADAARASSLPAPHLIGVDSDARAADVALDRLAQVRAGSVLVRNEDFLEMVVERPAALPSGCNLVISNPPYVRTQVLGAARSQALARQFDLAGRVDLYHAFVVAMTAMLGERGVLGLLASNRFLTTRGGQSLRSLLLRNYEIAELWDLGDTKMFEAAVLPAVVIGRRTNTPLREPGGFVKVYESPSSMDVSICDTSLLHILEGETQGAVKVLNRCFTINRGQLIEPGVEQPWRLTSSTSTAWLHRVKKRTVGRFGDLGPIRVGIKTTADSVFIRASWQDLPHTIRPEDELLRPLLTHRVAARWRVRDNTEGMRWVLYPHETRNGRREPVDLVRFPRAAAYLEQHRPRLEGRDYVRKSKRAWYEIWVPQQPSAWSAPKLVWPDISEKARFFVDHSGSIVNGDCYWLSCDGRSDEEIALALAIANSSFALQHYDLCCGNRLYSGRRRFMTQYLQELPIPLASAAEMREVAAMVEQLREPALAADHEVVARIEGALDAAVFELFGIKESLG